MEIKQSNDYKEIAHLNKTVHDLHVKLYPDSFMDYREEDIMEEFKQLVSDERFTFLILSVNGKNKGFIFYEVLQKPSTPFKKGYKSLYVHQISVLESEQGKGYGFALMDRVQQIAEKEKVDYIELDYWVGNTHAKHFYNKLGFEVVREYVRKDLKPFDFM